MRKLASIVRIGTTYPIPDSDRLSVAIPEGTMWRVVTARDEFKEGDLAMFFEIDAGLPPDDPRYEFLHERALRKFVNKHGSVLRKIVRIRTVKLRGVISQGLLIPILQFPEAEGHEVGDDMTEALGVLHYDDVAEEIRQLLDTSTKPGTGRPAGAFPWYVPKTDETRIQSLPQWVEELKGVKFEVTLKMDGSSASYGYAPSKREDKDPFFVCSRNFELKRPEPDEGVTEMLEATRSGSTWWEMAFKYELESKLKAYCEENKCELCIQGEIVGPGMNGNRDELKDREFRVFRIWDIGRQYFLTTPERVAVCEALGLLHVPILAVRMDVFNDLPSVDEILKFAEGKTASGHEREGLVFKEADTHHPRSFKAVSNAYLLKQK